MARFNKKRKKVSDRTVGKIAGTTTPFAGKYTNEQLLRRLVMANLLWESSYYTSKDEIMKSIDELLPKVSPEFIAALALEVRFNQGLRHTSIYLALSLYRDHRAGTLCTNVLSQICTRPDMTMDVLKMASILIPSIVTKKNGKLRKIPNSIKKGLALAFDNYDYYQIAKYAKNKHETSLVDVVNMVHPVPKQNNKEALHDLIKGQLKSPETWENQLSSGKNKAKTFKSLITEGKLGSLAMLRNIRNMIDAKMKREDILKGLRLVNSRFLTPLDFLKASRFAPSYRKAINAAMERCFANYKIPGTTIIALDISGSMGSPTYGNSKFTRADIGMALMGLACYVFEDPILVYTSGSDTERKGKHMIAPTSSGLDMFNDFDEVRKELGYGGIFTKQLCDWLIEEGHAKDAERLVVISDSQDVDVAYGNPEKPNLTPYKTKYIIDISHEKHGIKTNNWTAEINGSTDKLFRFIYELESKR